MICSTGDNILSNRHFTFTLPAIDMIRYKTLLSENWEKKSVKLY